MTTYGLYEADDDDIELFGFGEAAVAVDETPPVISLVSPVSGTAIGVTQSVSHRVTDETALHGFVLLARFGHTWEAVYRGVLVDGDWEGDFAPLYTGSTIAPVSGGFDFTVRRMGGWPASFLLEPVAFDGGGNVNA